MEKHEKEDSKSRYSKDSQPISKYIDRRTFIKKSTTLCASTILGFSAFDVMHNLAFAEFKVDMVAVQGADYFESTIKAIEMFGGMDKFVSRQSKVGLLINTTHKLQKFLIFRNCTIHPVSSPEPLKPHLQTIFEYSGLRAYYLI